MCHLCDNKLIGLGILEFADRNRALANSYGEQSLLAISAGDSRHANITARQAARYGIVAEHLTEEYRRRFKEHFGHDPADPSVG